MSSFNRHGSTESEENNKELLLKANSHVERENLLTITRAILDAAVLRNIDGARIIKEPADEWTDLFIILEKVLLHRIIVNGSGSSTLKGKYEKFYKVLKRVAYSLPKTTENNSFGESLNSIAFSDFVSNPILMVRAWLRYAVYTKMLSEYLAILLENKMYLSIYEAHAIVNNEQMNELCGRLPTLSAFDFVPCFENEWLISQKVEINISRYFFITNQTTPIKCADTSIDDMQKEMIVLADQKSYYEQRCTQLEQKLNLLTSLQHETSTDLDITPKKDKETKNGEESVNAHSSDNIQPNELTDIEHMQDTIQFLENELIHIRDLNCQLIEKTGNDDQKLKEYQRNERKTTQQMKSLQEDTIVLINENETEKKRLLQLINTSNTASESDPLKVSSKSTNDLTNKETNDENHSLTGLQLLLQNEVAKNKQLDDELAVYKQGVSKLPTLHDEVVIFESKVANLVEQNKSLEKQLEIVCSHLNSQRLKCIEYREELKKYTKDHWQKDDHVTNCHTCNLIFSVAKRKHHCRWCGKIFCHDCSSKEIRLSSSADKVRVCDKCYDNKHAVGDSDFVTSSMVNMSGAENDSFSEITNNLSSPVFD